MAQPLTARQQEYLDFIRKFIQETESAPRLDEIADHFGVTSPTANKALHTLQDKGILYSARDRITGFYIRVPERIGTTAPFYEINLIGKVNRYGEVIDFTEKYGHFPITCDGSAQQSVFAVELWQHIPNANMQAGDLIIFDQEITPQSDQIGIIPWGKGWLLARLFSLRIDEDLPFFPLLEDSLYEWEALEKEMEGFLLWWPLAYSKKTDDYFTKAAVELEILWRPIPFDYIIATAIRLDRPLAI